MIGRHRIGQAFSAAEDYERHARVQRRAAQGLAARIASVPLPKNPRILEIGCGTGFLTQALLDRGIDGDWLITDISPEMVARCRENIGDAPNRRFAVLDGEFGNPAPDGPFDLICSGLALQWFDDQESAVPRMLDWLAPDGHCLFTTLGERSFAEWRAAHDAEGLCAGTIEFLPARRFDALLPQVQAGPHEAEIHVEAHESGLHFLRALKAIGAQAARRRHRPLGPGELRRVVSRFEQSGAKITYEVITCHYRKAEAT